MRIFIFAFYSLLLVLSTNSSNAFDPLAREAGQSNLYYTTKMPTAMPQANIASLNPCDSLVKESGQNRLYYLTNPR